MRTLVHLRHAEREPGGVHLTAQAVRLSAQLGRRLGSFDRVIASSKPRAVETAEAMGHAVDERLAELSGLPAPLERWLEREVPRSFSDYVAFVRQVEEARVHAAVLAHLWERELDRLSDGGRLLIVSHAGVIELGVVGALGQVVGLWGPTLAHLEGVELERGRSGWSGGRVVRRER